MSKRVDRGRPVGQLEIPHGLVIPEADRRCLARGTRRGRNIEKQLTADATGPCRRGGLERDALVGADGRCGDPELPAEPRRVTGGRKIPCQLVDLGGHFVVRELRSRCGHDRQLAVSAGLTARLMIPST